MCGGGERGFLCDGMGWDGMERRGGEEESVGKGKGGGGWGGKQGEGFCKCGFEMGSMHATWLRNESIRSWC